MKTVLHIFNDQLGFFTNKTVQYLEGLKPNANVFLNTAPNCKNNSDKILYSSLNQLLKNKDSLKDIKLVIFHSYNYSNKGQIQKIKTELNNDKIKFVWIFWSHEFYQLPEFFSMLYQGFSRKFYLRKILSFHVDYFLKFFKGQFDFPFYLGLKNFKKTFTGFDTIASLVKHDYLNVTEGIEGVKYAYVSYISLNDFPKINHNFHDEKNDIMIGHSGSPILNHYEIIEHLSKINAKNNIYIPLAYGKPSYIKALQHKINSTITNLNITIQSDFMPKDEYYKKIESVGYFFLNSYCQQALANIFFFLWVGTKVYLRKNTSSYKSLKEKGFHVASIEDDFNELIPLTTEEKIHNHKLVEEMINQNTLDEAWSNVMLINH